MIKRLLIIVFLFMIPSLSAQNKMDFTRITSDGKLILDYKKKIADFFENVKVKTSDGLLKSDKLTVFFDSLGNDIDKMIAVGNVFIDQKAHQAEAQRAEFLSSDGKLVLTGNPVIRKGSNYYAADVIIIDTNTNKVYFEPSARIMIRKDDQKAQKNAENS